MIFKFIFKLKKIIKNTFGAKFNNKKINNYKNKKIIIKKKLKNVNKYKSYKEIKYIKDKIFNYFIYKLTLKILPFFELKLIKTIIINFGNINFILYITVFNYKKTNN